MIVVLNNNNNNNNNNYYYYFGVVGVGGRANLNMGWTGINHNPVVQGFIILEMKVVSSSSFSHSSLFSVGTKKWMVLITIMEGSVSWSNVRGS